MSELDWVEEFPAAVTVCDRNGVIVAMNARSCATFAAQGGRNLVGKSLLDCHPGASKEKLQALLASGSTNSYTIEKNGIKKLIYQAPWFKDGTYAGFVELSLPIPFEMPHFVRG
jgi:transcriptional regulator with PAS, ATPase and Fis domain